MADILGSAARLLAERGADPSRVVLGTPESSPEIRRALASGTIRDLEGVGDEGFVIVPADGAVLLAANRPQGVLFGVGRLLREGSPSGELRSAPALPVRSIYFASHMGNWYSHASAADVRAYLDEMALWGYNELTTVLEVRPGETFPEAWERLHALEEHARSLGMRVARIAQSNTSFEKPPDAYRATPGPIPGAFDVCPSKPGARAFLVEDKRRFFFAMRPFDAMCLWPYDGGGCFCGDCAPWAATFLDLSAEIAARAVGDAAEVRVSAWFFERDAPGEDDALFACLEGRPRWFRDVVAGAEEARRWRRDGRAIPEPYRVLLFPDISMFDGIPWGGRGANPAPRRFAAELADVREMLAGAVVYSEGRYDDLNKVLWAQMLWDPDRDPADIVREYCSAYLGPAAAREAAGLVADVERGMDGLPDPERWRRGMFRAEWDERAAAIEAALEPRARDGWRWQLLRAKTRIEALCAALAAGDPDALARLRDVYEHLQFRLNLHDPERSLPTWVFAPLEEAFAGVVATP